MQIKRSAEIEILNRLVKNNPVVAILGPRQCGKTTLSRQFSSQWKSEVTFFDLENPRDVQRLDEPMLALENASGLIIIDEIQRTPDLFPVLRVLADRNKKAKYLILGSASRVQQIFLPHQFIGTQSRLPARPYHFFRNAVNDLLAK